MDKQMVLDEGTSFIKVLGPDFSKQLQIPHDFTKTFNGHVPHRFFIESSMTKKCWRVEVEEDGEGMTHLRDGWAAFAEAHCLEVGDFLLFEYEEQSIFQVKIYSQNGCRKKTFVNRKESHPSPKIIDIEEDSKGESLECEPQIFRKTRHERTRNLSMLKDNNGINRKQHAVSKARRKSSKVGENRTSFSVWLAKKHQFSQLTIPMAVGLEKKLVGKEEVVLQDAKGNCWPVRLGHKKNGYVLLLRGWKHFLDANNIVIGDILNFDFISDKLVEVHVTRSSKTVDNHHEAEYHSKDTDCDQGMPQGSYATKDQTFEASITPEKAECELRCASFSFPWSKSRALTYLYIPKAIAKQRKLKNKESVALRDTDGKYWPLEVKTWHDGRVALTKGWCDFWKGLALENGDILEFEFVSHRRIQVSIHRCDGPHKTITKEATIDMDVMDMKGSANELLDSIVDGEMMDMKCSANEPLDSTGDMEMMDIKGFANDLSALTQEHYLLQTPPGFKPMEQHHL